MPLKKLISCYEKLHRKRSHIFVILLVKTLKPSFTYKVRLRFFQDNDTFTNRTILKVAKALSIYFCF